MTCSIAVVGASGFIGKNFVRSATEKGYDVCCLSRTPVECGGQWRHCDVATSSIVLPKDTEAVVYLAQSAYYREFPEKADDLFGVNVLGAVRTAQAALRTRCRFFCYASTGNVYAPSFAPLSEEHPVSRLNPYGLSKLMAEEALQCFVPRLAVLNARIFGAYGPGQEAMLPYMLLRKIIRNEPIILSLAALHDNDGLRVSFIYNDDLACCLLRIVEKALRGDALPPRLNLAGPSPVSIRQMAQTMALLLNREVRFLIQDSPRAFDLVADISLLEQLVAPRFTPLEDGLRAVCAPFSENMHCWG